MGEGGVRGSMLKARVMSRAIRGVAQTNKPVIAAVQGVCIGMSFGLALACDFIIAADNARFQFAFRHVGLALDAGGRRSACSAAARRRSRSERGPAQRRALRAKAHRVTYLYSVFASKPDTGLIDG